MTKTNEIFFIRLVSLLLHVFSIIIIPFLIGISYVLREKIERAYEEYGQDRTIKLINQWGVFGLFTIIFRTRRRREDRNELN